MNVNDIIHGFKVLTKKELAEANSISYTLEHEKSGARLLFLENDDDNKVFSIAFRTPPVDDTGVAHIVEHSVLCGSRKYPLKEPFVELVKGSLNTFLNAMTYPDKTMYPVASRNDKDFQNLMDVYLDAVFYPSMRENKQVLMQEGWHYEIENAAEPLKYSGVVYNEMKGATSSPDDMLENYIMHALYPDSTYGFESGGDPSAIPELTQEGFIDFHSRYYHPSNSYIFLYGDMDIAAKLEYLDREYLAHFTKIDINSKITKQEVLPQIVRTTKEYPIGAEESSAEKTFLTLSWVTGDALNVADMLGLQILKHALFTTEAAPLRQLLIDAQLGKDVDTILETDIYQPFFSIIVSNSEEDKADKFYELIMSAFNKYVAEGLDKNLLEASLNVLEFRLREGDFGRIPKGLIYNIQALSTWLYDGEPENGIAYEDLLKDMKAGLANGYFEGLIKKYLLDNKHQALIVMKPSTTMAKEREQKLAAKLARIKEQLSASEIEKIIAATKELKENQARPDTPEALATIPVLKLSDIKKEADKLPLEEREAFGTKVLFSDVATSGITYLDFYFDAMKVAKDDLFYLCLLAEFIGRVDTSEHSYAELSLLENLNTGGITADLDIVSSIKTVDKYKASFRLSGKALTNKLDKMFVLLTEIINKSAYTDKKRIRELIEQKKSSLEISLQSVAQQVAINRALSYVSISANYADLGLLPYYHFLKDFLADFDSNFAKMQQAFARIIPALFNKNSLVASITGTKSDYSAFEDKYAELVAALNNSECPTYEHKWELAKLNEGLTSTSQVQYVAKAANFKKLGFSYNGAMRIVETMLRYDYFWTKIRVQGGAYGAMTAFNPNGNMYFCSYRDPNLTETIAVYDGTADYLENVELTERELVKYIIGTMSGIDMPLTPQQKGVAAAKGYFAEATQEDKQRTRDEILTASAADIKSIGKVIRACMSENALCVFGGEEKVKSAKAVLGAVKSAL